ncbi:hypothetical protein J3F84DRAFT_392800 [Trichoderma pleuroticola]
MTVWLEVAADAGVTRSLGNGNVSESGSPHCYFLIYLGNISTIIISTVTIILWLAAGLLYKVDDLNELEYYDMLPDVCTRTSDYTLTRTMRYAWWAVIVVGVLELTALGTVVWAICTPKERKRGYQGLAADTKGWSDINCSDVEWGTQTGEACIKGYSIFLPSYLTSGIFSTQRATQTTR